ncbi:DUF308 domain-containing protein [Aerococcaceae bacterium NML191219]|nr:DUF308 domain-containing protein [Aerococcaceae bacterium NML191219]
MGKFFNFVIGVLFIAFGIYLWNHPAETLVTYSLYLGLANLAGAIVALIYHLVSKTKPVPYGNIIMSFLTGAIIMALPLISLSFILWTFIFGFLAFAVFYLVALLNNKSEKRNFFYVALAVLAVIYGLIMLFNPIAAANTMAKILAVFVIVNGVSYFVGTSKA